ncbi:TetR/AcrR family transcriptional regulator [Mycobacterium vicinigordonae]|uniref:TetR/AcrR family transcriptional regulator n=1 Tax=Mycobacterium vicinigordonae TaxID=1719132 RepID=A0A7D6E0A1_9MYCO|nr:TetR/AcrR family transcriptional regulator [Mycobacterium vicinigordonae]QLL09064.1 TetR/AcrR family transcriptional regulator [Mycobacterium vicinigordonae]
MAAPRPGSLADAKRQAAVDHILAAARRLVLGKGLDVTMDDLAEVSGASRRTLFRHFTSRDKLIAAAFDAGIVDYRHQLPRFEGDLTNWLRETCDSAHRMNATIGPGFFELASRQDLSPELAAAETKRLNEFRGAMTDICVTLWRAGGHQSDPPASLYTTVCAHLSPHFTAALMIDAGQTWAAAAELAYLAIESAMHRAIDS